MIPRFIDTHCHVHFNAYKEDMDAVVKRSLENGVQMITIGTQSSTSKNGIDLAERYDGIWCTIGLHPNHIHAQEFFDANELPESEKVESEHNHVKTRSESFDSAYYESLIAHPKVVAVGEFGLDYYRLPDALTKEQLISDQKRECKEQLRFASTWNKPVVIHCRDAHEDQYHILKQEIDGGGLQARGVIHSFTGTIEDAERYHELGFMLGLNGILVFSKELQQVIKNVPLSQIVLETDAPYLTPPPNRGKRNEPKNVIDVASFLAELKGISIDQVAEQTTYQAQSLFRLH